MEVTNLYRAVVWFDADNFEDAVETLKRDAYTVTELQERETN